MKSLRVPCNSDGINQVIKIIKNGGVAVFPTDTVYGIGGDPFNKNTVDAIYKIKRRNADKSLPILGYSKYEISKIVEFDSLTAKIAENFWPGPVTLILKLTNEKIRKTMGLIDKVAVRVPNNECVLSVLKECKLVVGTSANVSGKQSPNSPDDLGRDFVGFDIILDGGKIPKIGESTILEIVDGKFTIHREGKISLQEISKVL